MANFVFICVLYIYIVVRVHVRVYVYIGSFSLLAVGLPVAGSYTGTCTLYTNVYTIYAAWKKIVLRRKLNLDLFKSANLS